MSVMKVWDNNANAWVKPFFAYPKIWNGSDWVYGHPKIWTGTGWSMLANDSKTITVGSGVWAQEYVGSGTGYGYDVTGYYNGTNFGAISPNDDTVLVDEGGYLTRIVYEQGSDFVGGSYWMIWMQIRFNNTRFVFNENDWGWNTLNIGGYTYSRSAAGYTGGLDVAQWMWTLTSTDPNPFGTSGTKTVTWS